MARVKKIKGVLVDTINNEVKGIEIEKKLESYYELLNCDTIDIITRFVGDLRVEIVCDDEGLLKNDPITSALDYNCNPILVGNLFIVKFDNKSDITSLTDEEINYILNNYVYEFLSGRKVIAPISYKAK